MQLPTLLITHIILYKYIAKANLFLIRSNYVLAKEAVLMIEIRFKNLNL